VQWKKRRQTDEGRKAAKRTKLDPDQGNSAADERLKPLDKEGEHELTRSQIKNRKKKEKKLKAKDARKEEKASGKTENETNGEKSMSAKAVKQKSSSSPKPNSLPSSKIKPKPPSTETVKAASSSPPPPPKLDGITTIATVPPTQRTPSLANGIKHSSSPSLHSNPHSPPTTVPTISSPAPEPLPHATSIEDLRARLTARISQARVARKAVGTSVPGAPQTREAILQARAKRKAKVEEKIKAKKAAALATAKEAGVDLKKEDDQGSSEDEIVNMGLTFNKVHVNGTEIDIGKSQVKPLKKQKGASDAKGQLNHLLARESRLSKLAPENAERAIEHDRWHHALLASRGEKDKNDIGLLKKTIVRKERAKRKSKREWDARVAAVERGKVERQRRREENIAKRREEKGGKKGGGKKAGGKGKKKGVVKKRPGFEGGRVKFGRK
jgi:hypothetical protein